MFFFIRILDSTIQVVNELEYCTGEIKIGSFLETFLMPLDWWSIADYKQQWHEGFERIKTHNVSCLITEIQDPTIAPWVVMWSMYKKENNILIQNRLAFGKYYKKEAKKHGPITRENCYAFVLPYTPFSSDGITKLSEWIIPLDQLLNR